MCSKGLAKFILFAANFFLFIAGGILLGFGIAAKVDPEGLSNTISSLPTEGNVTGNVGDLVANSANFMIAVGCFLFIFCFLGCFGGCCEIRWMLFLYWVALLLVILLEIALIIFAAVSPGKMKEESVKLMKQKFQTYKPERFFSNGTLEPPKDPNSFSWFSLQQGLECCGVESKHDYKTLNWDKEYEFGNIPKFTAQYPPSCCLSTKTASKTEGQSLKSCMQGTADTAHKIGCYDAVEQEIKKSAYIPIVVCVVVIFIELISIAAAIYLWREKDTGHISV